MKLFSKKATVSAINTCDLLEMAMHQKTIEGQCNNESQSRNKIYNII